MLRLLQLFGRLESVRSGLGGLPPWARGAVFVFALPGALLVLESSPVLFWRSTEGRRGLLAVGGFEPGAPGGERTLTSVLDVGVDQGWKKFAARAAGCLLAVDRVPVRR